MQPPSDIASKSSRAGARQVMGRRALLLMAALVTFLGLSLMAVLQAPRPDAYVQPELLSLDWWLWPVERNGELRLMDIGRPLHHVEAVSDQLVWLVGAGGLILHSDDGGKTWAEQAVTDTLVADALEGIPSVAPVPQAMSFTMPDRSPLAFSSSSADPVQQLPPAPSTQTPSQSPLQSPPPLESASDSTLRPTTPRIADLRDVDFVDARTGWIVGDGGVILRTATGGDRWELIDIGLDEAGIDLTAVSFADALRGIVVGLSGFAALTTDGGSTWSAAVRELSPYEMLRDVDYSGERILVATIGGGVVRSEDDGRSWRATPEAGVGSLCSIAFWSDTRGVVTGESGVLHTEDGGRTWRGDPSTFYSGCGTAVAGAGHAWAVRYGRLVRTTDEGVSWSPVPFPISVASIGFADSLSGWALGQSGSILATSDGGATWRAQTRIDSERSYVDAEDRFVVATRGGYLSSSSDGGRTWRHAPQPGEINSLDVVNSRVAWAAGRDSLLLRTTDAGRTWERRSVPLGITWAEAIAFVDSASGYAATPLGVYVTRDAGANWTLSGEQDPASDISLVGQRGAYAIVYGSLFRTRDGGVTWTEATNPVLVSRMVNFVDDSVGWVADLGTIHRTVDGGSSWESRGQVPGYPMINMRFSDSSAGWAVNSEGTLFRTANGGSSWSIQIERATDAVSPELYMEVGSAARSATDGRWWIVGPRGYIASAVEGDVAWADLRAYRAYPAPWYFAGLLLVPLLLVPVVRRPPDVPGPESIDESMVSDRPLEKFDRDAKRLTELAEGVSRFLRNNETRPPLTIAVTGPWGSGKSSLMNLIRSDLVDRGFRPVWFNAWHHQTEERLLSALLENVRRQAVPPWWWPRGVPFRARLLWTRGWRHWMPVVLVLSALAFSTGYLLRHPADAVDAPARLRGHLADVLREVGLLELDSAQAAAAEVEHARVAEGSLMLAMLSGVLFLVGFIREGRAFQTNPAALLATLTDGARIRRFNDQLGFRHQFAGEFADVTRALGNKQMVIIIDDLDRCHPDNVLQVLESVNFLVSCGECFVVIGMDLSRVERAVGHGFRDLGAPLLDDIPSASGGRARPGSEKPEQRVARFARQYLEKLINIEVPVPELTVIDSRSMVEDEDQKRKASLEERVARFKRRTTVVLPIAAVVATVAFMFWLGNRNTERQVATVQPSLVRPSSQPSDAILEDPVSPAPPPTGTPFEAAVATVDPVAPIQSGVSREVPINWLLGVLAGILIVGSAGVARRPDVVEHDSPEFRVALGHWYPLVYAANPTPRAMKRFMNRVRYYAMIQRTPTKEPNVWQRNHARWPRVSAAVQRIFGRLEQRESAPTTGSSKTAQTEVSSKSLVPETELVALSALQHYDASWLERDALFKDPVRFLSSGDRVPSEILHELKLDDTCRSLGGHREAFERISSGVRIL